MILAIPGCWACEEMGALLAGVFCGVLLKNQLMKAKVVQIIKPYGAVRISDFLLRIGSDMLQEHQNV